MLLTLIGTAVFALLAAGPRIDGRTLALILAIVMLSQVAIAVFNDICDQDLDAARTPGRALPRGAIRQSTAFLLVVVSTGVCLTLSAQLGLALISYGRRGHGSRLSLQRLAKAVGMELAAVCGGIPSSARLDHSRPGSRRRTSFGRSSSSASPWLCRFIWPTRSRTWSGTAGRPRGEPLSASASEKHLPSVGSC